MDKLYGYELALSARDKVGTNYIYGYKYTKATQEGVNRLARQYPNVFTSSYLNKIKKKGMIGKLAVDCSGLISQYTKKMLGSSQLYAQAYARLPIAKWKDFAIGTVLWKSGHVGVYLGNGLVAEAKGIDYGTIVSKITDTKWAYGLTFSWIDYNIMRPIDSSEITYKKTNPYPVPTRTLLSGRAGEDVKWVQWELNEAGYSIGITGIFDSTTKDATIDFQRSCKIEVDGKVGPQTRKYLIGDTGK